MVRTLIQRLRARAALALQGEGHVAGLAAAAVARARFATGKVDLYLQFSNVCNYACLFCGRGDEKRVLRLADLATDDLVHHARSVDITGFGEITVHPEFEKILAYFSARHIPITFFTNGSQLSGSRLDAVCASSVARLSISLNSLDPDLYAELHGGRASLERVLANVRALVARRPRFPIWASFVLTARNLHEVPRFVDFVRDNGLAFLVCHGLTPTRQEAYPKGLVIEDTAEASAFLDEMRAYTRARGVLATFPNLANQSTLEAPARERLTEMIRGCDWVYTRSFVETDGTVVPCCWSRFELGNVRERSFGEIWRGERYAELRRAVRTGWHPSCQRCRRLN